MRIVKIEGYWGNEFGFDELSDAAKFFELIEKAKGIQTEYISDHGMVYLVGKKPIPSLSSQDITSSEELEAIKESKKEQSEEE